MLIIHQFLKSIIFKKSLIILEYWLQQQRLTDIADRYGEFPIGDIAPPSPQVKNNLEGQGTELLHQSGYEFWAHLLKSFEFWVLNL